MLMTKQVPNCETLLIIGFGMATARLLNKLAELKFNRPIVIISREKTMGYNRIQLTPWLSGEREDHELDLVDASVWKNLTITTHNQADVVTLNAKQKLALLSNGQTVAFKQAVIAIGASPRLPNIPYTQQSAIRAFRTFEDGHYFRDLPKNSKVSVQGGGLLGLEAAWGLGKLGHDVTLIHRNSHLLNRQLSRPLALLLEKTFIDSGIKLQLNSDITGIQSEPSLTSLTLNSKQSLETKCLVVATGIEPNIKLAELSGINTHSGILINSQLETSEKNIYAIGECAEFENQTFGLVAPAYHQAEILAQNLLGADLHFSVKEPDTRLKISGLDVFSVGNISNKDARVINLIDHKNQRGRTLHILNEKIIGAELIGDLSLANLYIELIQKGQAVKSASNALIGRIEVAA